MAELIEGKKYRIIELSERDAYKDKPDALGEADLIEDCGGTVVFSYKDSYRTFLKDGLKVEECETPPREAEFATMEFDETDHLLSTEANRERLELGSSQVDLSGITDSIKRQFESGAVRDTNDGKPFVHSLQGYTRLRFGYHMSKNAKKYGANNFLLGIPTEVYLESLDRHLAQYISGDRSEDHCAAILFGIQGVMLNEEKEGVKANNYYGK